MFVRLTVVEMCMCVCVIGICQRQHLFKIAATGWIVRNLVHLAIDLTLKHCLQKVRRLVIMPSNGLALFLLYFTDIYPLFHSAVQFMGLVPVLSPPS